MVYKKFLKFPLSDTVIIIERSLSKGQKGVREGVKLSSSGTFEMSIYIPAIHRSILQS